MALLESETFALIALNRITEAHSRIGRVLKGFGSACQFFAEYDAQQLKLPPRIAQRLKQRLAAETLRAIEADLRWIESDGHGLISIFDPTYPELLKGIHDPPLCLYTSGNADLLKKPQLAIVGSRKASQAGIRTSTMFASALSGLDIVITSGLAYGIDSAAHQGSLQQSGETIAVFACGCDVIYPRGHERLALRIMERGLVVSEFPLGTRVQPRHFPQRNRIVTGLSIGILVVEAAIKSGSLISAHLAMEQSREVFAVPGSIFSTQTSGCHQLIKDGAKLTQSVEDIIEDLPGYALFPSGKAERKLSPFENSIMQHLSASPVSTDELFELTDIPINELTVLLVDLEIEGFVLLASAGYVLSKPIS